MKEHVRILVGYDGSPCANTALDDLSRAGLPRNAEVIILTVSEVWMPPPSNLSVGPAEKSLPSLIVKGAKSGQRQAANAVAPMSVARSFAMEAKAQLQRRFPAWVIKAEEATGSPSIEILKRAEELKPHLIVLGSQGQSGLGRFSLGSVSQKVANEAQCTVRVSRGIAWKDGSPIRILIGHDGTASSELAVSAVAKRVWPIASGVRLVAALDPTNGTISGQLIPRTSSFATAAGVRQWVETFMNEAAKKLTARQLDVSTRIEEGDPKCALIADAEEWGADCIFLGAGSANAVLEKPLLGSVATAVVARAHCSVEIVRRGHGPGA